ncbi:hypothetical protein KC19_10G085300 [Ceratodon purpureus]|uniref:Uncharacterized protein n=1 Tax=Ceratodon purpureus TaxID=3225 RepID=A0A8T0GLX8_CERPU|nr:hypothetical protein KC19_10G085300 [Ceratodon purpureus]
MQVDNLMPLSTCDVVMVYCRLRLEAAPVHYRRALLCFVRLRSVLAFLRLPPSLPFGSKVFDAFNDLWKQRMNSFEKECWITTRVVCWVRWWTMVVHGNNEGVT